MDFKTFLTELDKFPEQTVIHTGHAGRTFKLKQGFSPRHITIIPSVLYENESSGIVLYAVRFQPTQYMFWLGTLFDSFYKKGVTALTVIEKASFIDGKIGTLTTPLTQAEAKLFIENAS